MKNRTSLLLMEQLVMVLVFALAAAMCLQTFAKANAISRETALRDGAVILAQNAAEFLKASKGDTKAALSLGEEPYRLEISEAKPSVPGLRQVQIRVYGEQTLLFTLNTGWQEVLSP